MREEARDPGAPSRAEVEDHEATHLPFRIWCEVCVAGRRENPAHLRVPREPGGVPEVGFDYAFVRRAAEEETVTSRASAPTWRMQCSGPWRASTSSGIEGPLS